MRPVIAGSVTQVDHLYFKPVRLIAQIERQDDRLAGWLFSIVVTGAITVAVFIPTLYPRITDSDKGRTLKGYETPLLST